MLLSDDATAVWFTMGPECNSVYRVEQLFEAGATGVRLTFSFGTPELQEDNARMVKRVAERKDRPGTVVADLEGGNARLAGFNGENSLAVSEGGEVRIVTAGRGFNREERSVPVRQPEFLRSLEEGDRLFVGDGAAEMEVEETGDAVRCTAVRDSTIEANRSIVLQDGGFEPAAITEQDREHLAFIGRSDAFDMVALSFTSTADEVVEAREIMSEAGEPLPVVAKIETRSGVENADEICEEADAVMVARGDLGLFLPWEELGDHTERVVEAAQRSGTPWVMATQVVEGLERFAFPTRAEICDLHRWTEEGMDGVLLSHETAFADDPAGAVRSVRRILEA